MTYRVANLSRRSVLQWLGAAAVMGLSLPWQKVLASGAVAQNAGIVRFSGKVTVNGVPASLGLLVKTGDQVETGPGAEVIFVVGRDAYLQRAGSRIKLENASGRSGAQVLRMLTGKVLAVFGRGEKQIVTPTVTLGIRGTGIYVEAQADESYVCLCYGTADYIPTADPSARQTISAVHHDHPVWVYNDPAKPLFKTAPGINHTDQELIMLEALVGRIPPFVGKVPVGSHGDGYSLKGQ